MIRKSTLIGVLLSAAVTAPVLAQSMAPTETYLAYRKAFASGQSFDDVAPFFSKQVLDEMPEDQREMVFGFMQELIRDATQFKALSESITGDQAKVGAEFCIDDQMSGVDVDLAMDGGGWKIQKVHMSNDNYMELDKDNPSMIVPMTCE